MKPLALAALILPFSATLAIAEPTNCAPREIVTEQLNLTYGENFSGGGLQGGNAVFEVWISKDDGTWTILMTQANGVSCVMAAGTDWRGALQSDQVSGVRS